MLPSSLPSSSRCSWLAHGNVRSTVVLEAERKDPKQYGEHQHDDGELEQHLKIDAGRRGRTGTGGTDTGMTVLVHGSCPYGACEIDFTNENDRFFRFEQIPLEIILAPR